MIRYGVRTFALLVFAAVGLLANNSGSPWSPANLDADDVMFTSKPSPTARVNEPYVYTAHAVSTDPTATIKYFGFYENALSMSMAPKPLPIDSVTGVVNWTPTAKGWYEMMILAVSNKGGHERQEFNLLVSGGNGTIQGRVTDTLTHGIPNVIVQALKTDSVHIMEPSDDMGGFFFYAAKTDSNGYYTISHVDPGTYKLHAISTSPNFASQWYDGVTNPALATVITVPDSPEVSKASFVLRAGPAMLPKITVSGSVTDTADAVINGADARVFFVSAGFALNTNTSVDDFRDSFDDDHDSDFRMEGTSPHVFSTKPDSLGHYSLKIPVGRYIAFAKATGFITQFYLNQTDVTSANVLVLQSDSSNINFTLASLPPVALGSISGAVLDSSKGVGVRSRVIAVRDRWRSQDEFHVAPTYMTDTDSTGAYSFTKLLPGSYFVFAIPVGNYAPAYYTTDTASTHWKHATKLAVNGNTFSNINIYVRPLPASMQGYTGITGGVQAGGKGAVAGAFVYAAVNGRISGYGITDNTGNYSISGLVPGTYTVSVDKAGFDEAATQSVSVSYSNSTTPTGGPSSVPVIKTANFMLSGTTAVAGPTTDIVRTYRLGQNYPNPFNPSTTITFALPQSGVASLKVYNILGQEVATLLNGYQNGGTHQIVFNADKLSSGVYFYQLKAGSFVQSKKMVLLK